MSLLPSKNAVIKAIGYELILTKNYAAIHHFPTDFNFATALPNFLGKIEHIVCRSPEDLTDYELNDIYDVHANSKKCQNKIIHTDSNGFDKLLYDLKTYSKVPVDLALLGHGNQHMRTVAGLSAAEMMNTICYYDFITKITFLSCNAVKSAPLDQEIVMWQKLKEQQNKFDCGLLVLNEKRKLSEQQYNELLEIVALPKVWVISKRDDQTYLTYLTKTEQVITSQQFVIDEDQLNKLNKQFYQGKRSFPFPKATTQQNTLRKSDQPLSENELLIIDNLIHKVDRFEKTHKEYKKDKTIYPFLATMTIDSKEAEQKLKTSIIKDLFFMLKDALTLKRFKQPLTIEGHTKALHVDTKNQQLLSARSHLYPSSYKTETFFAKVDNIDRKKLSIERNQIKEQGLTDGMTHAKAIRIVFAAG